MVEARYRLRLARGREALETSHLEQVAALRRALKESGLPAALSSGRRALPKLAFGPALPRGCESRCEYVDMELTTAKAAKDVAQTFAAKLPAGFRLVDARRIPLHYPSVESLAKAATYELYYDGGVPKAGAHPSVLSSAPIDGGLEAVVRTGAGLKLEALLQDWLGRAPKRVVRKALWARTDDGTLLEV